ncbi:Zinc finger MYM-type protein 5 [Eumeta japonica]|uniref:Zinc finger MYM-type protein 5 n=1 Tax=Eumeta variegata TaxID=151549 RepID=A0A4C1YXT6_EUMVA|nr:Zinc finger MYM-type protein 5 [Eumeta japonica]
MIPGSGREEARPQFAIYRLMILGWDLKFCYRRMRRRNPYRVTSVSLYSSTIRPIFCEPTTGVPVARSFSIIPPLIRHPTPPREAGNAPVTLMGSFAWTALSPESRKNREWKIWWQTLGAAACRWRGADAAWRLLRTLPAQPQPAVRCLYQPGDYYQLIMPRAGPRAVRAVRPHRAPSIGGRQNEPKRETKDARPSARVARHTYEKNCGKAGCGVTFQRQYQQAIEDPLDKSSDHEDIEQNIQEDLAIPGTSSASQNITEEVLEKSLPSSFKEKKIDDISERPIIIDSATKNEILIRGPVNNEMNNENYPKNRDGRHFSNSHFHKVMPNGEIFKRRWLAYSKSADKVYCFCCRLLNTNPNTNLGKEGFDDWRHLSTRLKTHETSPDHRRAMNSWIEASIRLKNFCGIDKQLQNRLKMRNRDGLLSSNE